MVDIEVANVTPTGDWDYTLGDIKVPSPAVDLDAANKIYVDNQTGGTSHEILSATHTDSLVGTVSKGSLIIGNSTPKWAELIVGNDGQVLTAQADGTVDWEDAGGGGGSGTMTTVKEGGVQVGGADIVTLDFDGDDFNLTESPDTEINISINDSGIDHDALTNTHNLTTDIDHDALTNFTTTEHFTMLNEDDMVSDSDTQAATQQSIKAYIADQISSSVTFQGGYDAATNTPDLDTSPSGISKGDMYVVTVEGTFFTAEVEVGDVLISNQDNPTTEAHWTIVNKNLDAASIKVAYESNDNTNAFTDAEQTKLAGIETGADVTDATNVEAAGAAMAGGAFHDGFSDFAANEHIDHTGVILTAGDGLIGGGDISVSRTFNIGEGTGISVGVNDISTNDGEIIHDDLSGFVVNEHIDHTAITLTAGDGLTGGGDISSGRTFNVGEGLGITVGADTISTNDAEIDHDALASFVANEHINHTSVTLTAGDGLSGGGDISANRSFAVNVDDSTIEINTDTLRVKADGINDTHIDFGVGANQVSAVDIPIADAGVIITATEVEGALQENRTAINLNTTHRGLTDNPHSVTATQVGLGNVSNVATDDTAYDATSWNANLDSATKNAIRDKIETMDTAIGLNTSKVTNATHTGEVTGATTLTIADNIVDEANLKVNAPTNDFVLTADSGEASGMKWAASSSGFADPMTTRGDIIYKDATNTTTRLGAGTNTQVLQSDGTDISWETLTASDISDFDTEVSNNSSVAANTAKDTNVSTNLSLGTITSTTMDVNSSDGTDATLIAADTNDAGLLTAAKFDEIVANNAKISYTKTNVMGQIVHGSTAGTARPSGFDVVTWIGDVEPTNANNNDVWVDTA